jgi:two-component system chemotaxis sensor kinase CheA
MNDEHTRAFVSECHESITALNNALLALEDDPTDEEAIESVFRTAHTLKGNFGAMGFQNASELAHVLEDLLDEIRADNIEVSTEVIDATFVAVDRIETIVDEIDTTGESDTSPEETIERLQAVIEAESGTTGAATAEPGNEEATDGDERETSFAHAHQVPTFESADRVSHAIVQVDSDGMLGVDGMLVLDPLEDSFAAFETAPAREAIEQGEYDGRFDLFVANVDPGGLEDFLSNVGAADSVEATAISDTAEAESGDQEPVRKESVDEATPSDESAAEGTSDEEPAVKETGAGTETTETEPDGDEPSSIDGTTQPATDGGDENGATKTSRSGGSNISSVRVDVERLDELHGLVEQLVTGRITIRRAIEDGDLATAENSLKDLDKVTSRLQNAVMDMRLIPLRRVVSNLPRVVRDVASEQDKELDFQMIGEDIELDRSILTEIEDPLIHVLRNAVDHGIEPPDDREAAGKPSEGSIELRATRQRDHVTIEIEDDGGGIDPDAMRQKAVSEGVISESEAETLTDDEAYDLVFHPGFSTAEEVTDVSGRGVGMDVVHTTVSQLDGTVNVDSEPGEGTCVTFRLPVSVAIVDVLFVRVGQQEYGVPIKNIDELTYASDIETINGDEVVRHDDEIYRVIRLEEALEIDDIPAAASNDAGGGSADTPVTADGGAIDGVNTDTTDTSDTEDDGMLIRVRESVRPVALRCDEFTDQEEVVVKPLEGILSGLDGLSGTAILGDGNIVPILDVVSLDP